MLDNQSQKEAIVHGPYSYPDHYEKMMLTHFRKKSNNFNDFARNFLCTSINKYPDRDTAYIENVVDLSRVDLNNVSDPKIHICAIAHECITMFFNDFDTPMHTISKVYNNRVKEYFKNDKYRNFCVEMFHSVIATIDEILELLNNNRGVVRNLDTFRAYGRNPRITYTTKLPLFVVTESGETILFLDRVHRYQAKNVSVSMSNIRLTHFIEHFNEIGIRLDKVMFINYPLNVGERIYTDTMYVNKKIRSYATSFFKKDYTLFANPSNCPTCPYAGKCDMSDMIDSPYLY